ncbi:MAG: outer membrane beta-barrel protein [Pseudomonadota bacterium]
MRLTSLLLLTILLPTAAIAEYEVSLYYGNQTAPPSDISIRGDDVIPDMDFEQDWTGNSSTWPIYGGVRVTYWQSANFGYGLDWTHNKVEPTRGQEPEGFDNLEFTDGLNTWLITAYYRWPDVVETPVGGLTPYVGAGAGISLPGVEIRYQGSDTFEYQITGVAAQVLAGVSVPVTDTWSVFTEYKYTYTQNEVDLVGGGALTSDISTNAINIGISYRF